MTRVEAMILATQGMTVAVEDAALASMRVQVGRICEVVDVGTPPPGFGIMCARIDLEASEGRGKKEEEL